MLKTENGVKIKITKYFQGRLPSTAPFGNYPSFRKGSTLLTSEVNAEFLIQQGVAQLINPEPNQATQSAKPSYSISAPAPPVAKAPTIARGLQPAPAPPQKKPATPRTLEQDILFQWKNDPAFAQEFTTLGTYAAYRQAVADGRVKESRQPKQTQAAESSKASRTSTPPVGQPAKAEWDIDSDLREEFGGDFETYQCYRRADDAGQVKVLKR